ncbi:urea carboxylase [Ectothiorhodospira shaposhnikovii]|uniref:urea amidolyase associated protein UAAP2 n=1 Tax=Ectothiorhodospira shaposhnikovii TaxID=1054 RepID=UPI001908D2CE|nr:urea amidolyase associated protein UAAP2 [Ectothiorhodospira shaposhnikovii]MBK1673600.1 urea carboxylase [Ectothiorhodospira shaposhnikovii]
MNGQTLIESPLDPGQARLRRVVPAGEAWLHELGQGQTLRIVDLEGNQAADTLFYSLEHPTGEHYSAVHTIRAQGNVYLTAGSRLLSNLGRTMLTLTADTCGRHDTLGGACAAESNQVRYALEKKPMHNCRDSFLTALAGNHYGLTKRDLVPNINFFMNVPLTPEGGLRFEDGISEAGKYVEMRAEMDVIVLVSNCPQLNNPCNAYNPTPVEMIIWD